MTSKPPPRYVVLDDKDPSIAYDGPGWFQDSGSQDSVGNFGPPYLHTLHGTRVNGSAVSLEFNGTAIQVYGTNVVKDAKTNPVPNFECFIDDASIGRESPFEFGENNFMLCQKDGLSDGLHKLRIDIKVASQDNPFWLDQIRYVPSKNMPLDNTVMWLDNTDPAIRYDAQWGPLGDVSNTTTHTNSTALVDFIGVSVSWVAFIPTELPHTGATGSYSIDNGKPTQFLLTGLPPDKTVATVYNQFYFTTPDVEFGPHTLAVTFLGSEQTTPLCIDYLYIKNGTSALSANSGTGGTTGSPNSQDSRGSRGSPVGAILGGVIGGLAFIIAILAFLLFWRRRQARRANNKIFLLDTEGEPYDPQPHPPIGAIAHVEPYQLDNPSMQFNSTTSDTTPLTLSYPVSQQPNTVTRKQREAYGRAQNHELVSQPLHSGTSLHISEPSTPATTSDGTRVRQHEDSGIRLPGEPIVDVPPIYTVG